jgi:small subunit ribosomal protein S19e
MEVPNWADVVKTATYKELAPYDPDWFYVRAASMARKVYLSGPIGVGAFKKIHGGNSRRGVKPNHFKRASGSVARACLKQLEAIGVVAKHVEGGRVITAQGMRDLDRIAGRVAPPKEGEEEVAEE